ncbi:MAG TPA: hypothetical protein VHL59_19005, partial [Thermoanaerobaculia bacterium]|nr:hypothetical protein [Thermoanaerobaculia bacterium]
ARVLKQRNALLHDVAMRKANQSTLDAWDNELMVTAAVVHRARAAYASELAANRRDEIRARMTLAGPQRDVIEFLVDGRAAAEVLSGGEQKMIVLFLKFAKVELFRRRHDDAPLFLLDDVDAELDLEILQKLLSRLPSATQVFATSAKEVFLQALQAGPHRRLTLENGRVTAARDFG